MKNFVPLFILLVFCACLLYFSCTKENENVIGPKLILVKDTGLVSSDSTILIGHNYRIKLIATNGSANITNFIIKETTDTSITYLDSGLNTKGFVLQKSFTKGVSKKENWTFTVRDKNGKSASTSFVINADSSSTYRPIVTIPSVILGAQNNTSIGSFLDIKNVITYSLSQAYGIQDSIEMCYYFDFIQGEDNTIASPNANIDASVFPGIFGLANWAVKNETRYIETTISPSVFDHIQNDSMLIATYSVPISKRKAKNLVVGEVYSFKTAKGKFGMFKVLQVNGTDAGTIEIMIKIQPY